MLLMALGVLIPMFVPAGCSSPAAPSFEGAIYAFGDFALFPDSLFVGGTAVRQPDAQTTSGASSDAPIMDGSDHLLNAIFNSAEPTALLNRTVEQAPADSSLTAYRLYLYDALCRPDSARAAIERLISHRKCGDAGSLRWPVLAASIDWALAAREIWKVSGDEQWRDLCVEELMATLRRDRYLSYDSHLRLFRGATPTIVKFRALPSMNAADFAAIYSFGANVDRIIAYDLIASSHPDAAAFRDSLALAVENCFWLPDRGFFSEMLYQWPFPINLYATDNLAQGVAAVSGSISEAAAAAMIRNTPMLHDAFSPFYPEPDQDNVLPQRRALAAALWTAGAARMHNSHTFRYAFSMLTLSAVTTPHIGDIFRGATIRGLFGINAGDSCLTVDPFVPEEFGDRHILRNFQYRDAIIDLTVVGKGDVISTVMIDDEVVDAPSFPASLTGRHTMRVTLSGFASSPSGIRFTEKVTLPEAHIQTVGAEGDVSLGRFNEFEVYRDGELLQRIDADERYHLPAPAGPAFYSFVPIADDSIAGMAAPCLMRYGNSGIIRVKATSIARTGTRMFNHRTADKALGKQFVESSRFRNPRLSFKVTSAEGGNYLFQLVYLKGLGIVNPGRHYALRKIMIDDRYSGLLVLPQLTPADWKPDIKWWEFRGESLPLPIELHAGQNSISIDWFAPEAAGFTDDSNTVIPVEILLIPQP